LALWIAKQIGMPVVMARLDGLVSSFLGTSSRNIGNLFSFAARYRCILLLDEFDAIAKLRDDPQEVGEIKRVVNTLLQNLDTRGKMGFTIGVTNHEKLLDPAIWRRFDIQIEIPKPDIQTVPALLEKFLNPVKLSETEIQFLSWVIEGLSGADIQSLAKWIKKSRVFEPEESIVITIRKFAVLNGGRVENHKKDILFLNDIDFANKLIKEFGFSQTQISLLVKKSQSYFSKKLSKK
jgi:SpoVK/Ycf46/Vps4 family AAA+-type ATPase